MTLTTPSDKVLQVEDLVFERNGCTIFSGVNFHLEEGELLLLQGSNGCGKSTLMRILTTLVRPQQGRVCSYGENIYDDKHKYLSNIIFIGHQLALKLALSPLDNLNWSASSSRDRQYIFKVMDEMGLGAVSGLPCYRLSAGQLKRVALTKLFVSDAKLWLLDEPFVALDLSGISIIEKLINRHLKHNGSVLMTSHQDLSLSNIRKLDMSVWCR
ncbi:MAG: heme ABC exporter ATP-binding protein CcmA [Cellvibrionales bacterium TMED49]|nr:heme ABC transporter ATP-binding protein CcmA [Porticoccaceae bacterium]OUU39622.1 MAG: heme ABC exporter ATP-binding protein CcmA [Cellvibrionales bacterium TMED49]